MNSIIVDSMQQQKFEVHTPFHFEAVDSGTKTAREWATYASGQCKVPVCNNITHILQQYCNINSGIIIMYPLPHSTYLLHSYIGNYIHFYDRNYTLCFDGMS